MSCGVYCVDSVGDVVEYFVKQKTAYEMRISDWSSDVCSSDLRSFQRDAIDRLIAEDRVVLVDVTADWCLTCKVNKAAVLERGPVADRLGGGDVVAMRADWTSPDAANAEYLASSGRYGIPFTVVYGPAAPQGPGPPELLNPPA